MNIMFRPRDNYTQVDLLGIAVSKGTHTAFLYINEFESNKPYLMHLNGYEKLLKALCLPHDKYVWVDIPMTEIQKNNIIDFIEEIFTKSNGKLPYDIASQAFFNNDGSITLQDEFGGLTCATFVLSVFDTLAHPLIEYDTWPRTKTNKQDIDRWLPIVKIFSEHIFKVKKNKYIKRTIRFFRGDLRRYRAEEVAAAANKKGYPHTHNNIEKESLLILDTLNKVY